MTRNGKKIIIYRTQFPEEIRENVRGMAAEAADRYYVVIDQELTAEAKRKVLGHELAHIFLGHFDNNRSNDQAAEAEADQEAEKYYRLYKAEERTNV